MGFTGFHKETEDCEDDSPQSSFPPIFFPCTAQGLRLGLDSPSHKVKEFKMHSQGQTERRQALGDWAGAEASHVLRLAQRVSSGPEGDNLSLR